jgi:hypothetical protein
MNLSAAARAISDREPFRQRPFGSSATGTPAWNSKPVSSVAV